MSNCKNFVSAYMDIDSCTDINEIDILLWNMWLNEINRKCNGIRIMVLISIYYKLEVGLLDINDIIFVMKCEYNMWLSWLALWPSTRINVDFIDWLCDHRLWEMMIILIGFVTINN